MGNGRPSRTRTAAVAAVLAASASLTAGGVAPAAHAVAPDPATPAPPTPSTPAGGAADAAVAGAASPRSGLPWASGAYIPGKDPAAHEAFGEFRGAPTDVVVTFPARATWRDLTETDWMFRAWRDVPQTVVYSFPPIPEDGVSTLADCAAGRYDASWALVGSRLQSHGSAARSVIRLGWEFNGDWYAWAAREPAVFAECWRRVHAAVEAKAPEVRWSWTVNRSRSQLGIDPRDAYPGDAYVDVVGVDTYDWYPAVVDDATWREHRDGAFGLAFWADFARAHGKRLSVPEWGVHPGTKAPAASGGDNPLFIRKMLEFFASQRDLLAWESYFNGNAAYYGGSLFAPVQVPAASQEYARQVRALRAATAPEPPRAPAQAPDPAPVPDPGPVVRLTAVSAVPSATGVRVTASVSVDREVAFARLPRVAIRDAAGRSTDALGGLDTAFGPSTVRTDTVLSGTRALAAGAYTATVAYSLDGVTWVRGPATSFVVGPAAAPRRGRSTDSQGVRLSAPRVRRADGGVRLSGTVWLAGPVALAEPPRLVVRRADGTPGPPVPAARAGLRGSGVLTGRVALTPGTWVAQTTYSVDGTTWTSGPERTFRVP